MAMKMLKVRAKKGVLVLDPHAAEAGWHRYVGQAPHNRPVEDPQGRACFLDPIADGVELAEHQHIKEAVRKGELECLDEWTAKRCGLKNWAPADAANSKKGNK